MMASYSRTHGGSTTAAGRILLWLPVREDHYIDRPAPNEPKNHLKLTTEANELAFGPPSMLQTSFPDHRICVGVRSMAVNTIGTAQSLLNYEDCAMIPPVFDRANASEPKTPLCLSMLNCSDRKFGRVRDESSNHQLKYAKESSPDTETSECQKNQPSFGVLNTKSSGALCLYTAHTLTQSSHVRLAECYVAVVDRLSSLSRGRQLF